MVERALLRFLRRTVFRENRGAKKDLESAVSTYLMESGIINKMIVQSNNFHGHRVAY